MLNLERLTDKNKIYNEFQPRFVSQLKREEEENQVGENRHLLMKKVKKLSKPHISIYQI
ncbi:MAG: hypothetical protein WC454_09550 [Phycisphaerae bacterium]